MTASGVSDDLRERGAGELVGELSSQISTLVHKEIELARLELAEKAKLAGRGAGMFGGAGMAAALTLGSLTAFLIIVLALAMPAWAAALIVTALWAAVSAVLAIEGRKQMREMGTPVPEQTIETVKEDVRWLKEQR